MDVMVPQAAAPGLPDVKPAAPVQVSSLDGSAPDATDFANYFCTYGCVYHQVRVGVFADAIGNAIG